MNEAEIISTISSRSKHTLLESLGIAFTHVAHGHVIAEMPVDSRTVQPYGILHGGASAALSETIGSFGSEMILTEDNMIPVGIELNITHIKSVQNGKVIGTGKAVKIGRRMHVWHIDITNETGDLVATSRLTVMVIEKK